MSHAEVRERLELAALEPDGLDRLMAGDTMEAAAIATHLAGCPACLDELGRLERATALVRQALEPDLQGRLDAGAEDDAVGAFEEPVLPPALRERTLAFVREHGVQRPVVTLAQAAAMVEPAMLADPTRPARPAPATAAMSAEPVPITSLSARAGRRWLAPFAWAASLAAVLVVSVIATAVFVGNASNEDTADLTRLAAWSIDIARAPDARQVALISPSDGQTAGLLAFVPSTEKLVVSAHDLALAPTGKEYRCWVQIGGGRKVVGKMHFAGGIAYWVGPVGGLGAIASGTHFGITLVDASGSSIDGDPVLLGTL
jgi:hypothetical protein